MDTRKGGFVRPKIKYLFVMSLRLVAASILVTGCKSSQPPESCKKEFEVTIVPKELKRGQAHFTMEQLKFLFTQKDFVLTSVDLIVTVEGKRHQYIDYDLAFNGIKSSRRDGRRCTDRDDYDSRHNHTVSHIPIHKHFLNGGESFKQYLNRLQKNKGVLRIDLDDVEDHRGFGRGRNHCRHGDDMKIVSIKLVFKGYTYNKEDCTTPPPPPPPEDPSAYSPHIDSTIPALSPTAQTNMTINFSAQSTGGTFYCSLDGGPATICQSPAIYQNLADGAHTFEVSATTPSGQPASATDSYTWTVDALPPDVTITNAGFLPILTTSNSINFEFASSKDGSSFTCSLDGGTPAACSSPYPYIGLSEGAHHFEVSATDSLGNVSAVPATFDWVVDATSPVTAITAVTPDQAISNNPDRSITFSASEVATFKCSLDGGGFLDCTSPNVLNSLSEGNHVFEVYATDLAGNVGPTVSYAWLNDYTAPVLSLDQSIPANGLINSKNVSVHFSSDEAADYFCSVDGGDLNSCSSPFAFEFAQDGHHEITIIARDSANNESNSVTAAWDIDTTAPLIAFAEILPSSSTRINSSDITFVISGSEGATLVYSLNGVNATAVGTISFTGLTEGLYGLVVHAVDSAGNTSNTLIHQFAIDLTAPNLAIDNPGPNPTQLDSRSISFVADEDVTFTCQLDDAGFAPCQSPTLLAGLADGSHTFDVRAADLAGNITDGSTTWVVDTIAPVTTLTGIQNNNAIDFNFSANESTVTFECSFDGAAFSPCTGPVSFFGLEAGDHVFAVRATDSAGNVEAPGASYSFSVIEPIHTLITSTNPSALITNSTNMTIAFDATRATSGYVCSFDGSPYSSCTSAVSLSSIMNGPHEFTVKAIDEFGVMDPLGATHSWTVDTLPPEPSAPPILTIGVNSILVQWTTNEPATSQVRFGIGGSTSINQSTPDTGVYTTTHSVLLTGLSSNTLYSLQVSGRDQAGNSYLGAPVSARTRR